MNLHDEGQPTAAARGHDKGGKMSESVDVVVVGAGNAALTAALEARAAGADVLMLERAPENLRGGNTRFTGGIFRFSYPDLKALDVLLESDEDLSDVVVEPYTSSLYRDDMDRLSEGKNDPDLTKVLIDSSYETTEWLHALGVRWEFARTAVEARAPESGKLGLQLGAAVRTRGKGPALSDTLFARIGEASVAVQYETEATGLRFATDGQVNGVEIQGPGGAPTIQCGGVVLACGGFESDRELRRQFLGEGWARVKVRGTSFNSGSMLQSVIRAGAGTAGDFADCHATPIAADSPEYGDLKLGAETNRLSYPYGIMVNCRGERFADEGEDFKLYTYAKLGKEIQGQPHGLAIQLFDAQATELLEERYHHTNPLTGDTIDELAALLESTYGSMGVRKDDIRSTVETYNNATTSGRFDPTELDGLSTHGLTPEKTNWARPLEFAPFTAYPVTTGITFTFGGLRIGPDANVVTPNGESIPGLYATGEITGGIFYNNYPAGAGLMRGAVFGRLAGAGAAGVASPGRTR
jgi:tricarballylate dehydrogenase